MGMGVGVEIWSGAVVGEGWKGRVLESWSGVGGLAEGTRVLGEGERKRN